jgi:hypothetical protein
MPKYSKKNAGEYEAKFGVMRDSGYPIIKFAFWLPDISQVQTPYSEQLAQAL